MNWNVRSLGVLRIICLALLMLLAHSVECYAETRLFGGNLNLQKYGSGEFKRFGFLVYEAQLWAGTNSGSPPLALQLTYKRHIAGEKIVSASVDQMRALGADEQRLKLWSGAMSSIFPDVKPGDQIVGVYRPDKAIFFYNNREIGQVNDPEFAQMFFGIWLDPRTSEPRLRERLLQPGAG